MADEAKGGRVDPGPQKSDAATQKAAAETMSGSATRKPVAATTMSGERKPTAKKSEPDDVGETTMPQVRGIYEKHDPESDQQKAALDALKTLAELDDETRTMILAHLGVPEAVYKRPHMMDDTRSSKGNYLPPTLERISGSMHLHEELTDDMDVEKAAKLFECEEDEILAYAVRAPLNVDGKPITKKAVLRIVKTDGTHHAVPYEG